MKRFLVLLMVLLVPLSALAWKGDGKGSSGTGTGDVTTSALTDSLTALRAKASIDSLFVNYFESLFPIHWDAITKKAAFDTTSSDSIEGYTHTLVSLPPAYATFWTVRSIADADSDSCMISEVDFPVTTNPDSARIWVKPSSTTKISVRVVMKNGDGDIVGNKLIILTSTDWTEYVFAFRTGTITANEKINTYLDIVLEDREEIHLGNLEVW